MDDGGGGMDSAEKRRCSGAWSRGGWYRGLPARSASGRVLDAINFLQTPQHVAPPRAMKALLGGADVSSVDLAAYGVEVLLEGK
jgi:hypothetical protein